LSVDKALVSSLILSPFRSHFVVECPKGSQFTAKWLLNGENIKEDSKALSTDKSGIISYLLEGTLVKKGSYSFEVYYEGRKVLEKDFQIE
jgi:hypothetical protein